MSDDKAVAEIEKEKPKFAGKELVPTGTFSKGLEPRNFEETMALANLLAKSDIVPKDFQGKPANILVAVAMGRELGVGWAQSLQNIMVLNGRPSTWGDIVMGLVLSSGYYEDSHDEFDEKKDGGTAIFYSKRKGKRETVRTFSHEDAKKAGLLTKDTYQKYERRMLFNRSRAWALRDDYSDVLKGLRITEEEQDIIEVGTVAGQRDTFALPALRTEAVQTQADPSKPEPVANSGTDNAIKTVKGKIEKLTKYDGGVYAYIEGAKFFTIAEGTIKALNLAKEQDRAVEIAYEDEKDRHIILEVRLSEQN